MNDLEVTSIEVDQTTIIDRLMRAEIKLSGMSHLIEGFDFESIPLDKKNFGYGLGMIIRETSDEIGKIWRELEDKEIGEERGNTEKSPSKKKGMKK